jgi:uncharacterized protein with HEPN domain
MLNSDLNDKLLQSIKAIQINFERVDYALQQIKPFLPLTPDTYFSIKPEIVSCIDQYIFRFAKCQDLIGDRLFRLLLAAVEEEIETESFLNILNKLEKFGIINDKVEWIALRKLRNLVSHEYPTLDDEAVSALNELFKSSILLKEVFERCMKYLQLNKII